MKYITKKEDNSMKKMLAWILVVAMLLSMAACGGEETPAEIRAVPSNNSREGIKAIPKITTREALRAEIRRLTGQCSVGRFSGQCDR